MSFLNHEIRLGEIDYVQNKQDCLQNGRGAGGGELIHIQDSV